MSTAESTTTVARGSRPTGRPAALEKGRRAVAGTGLPTRPLIAPLLGQETRPRGVYAGLVGFGGGHVEVVPNPRRRVGVRLPLRTI
jgi:hypothetical protein